MSAMDALQLYMSYTVLTIVACSVAIIFLSFSSGSTSKQIELIGELRTVVERVRKTCEQARSAALWSADDAGRFVGMSNLLSFSPEPNENVFVEQANQFVQALTTIVADTGDLRVSALRRRIAEVKRIEGDCHALLAALEARKKPAAVHAEWEAHAEGRFQRLTALQ
jgi:hypothetical protein